LALAEAKTDYTRYEIDLQNKPEWYAPKVNPASKVPAATYGGPKVAPDQPSPESHKFAESLILVEFVADVYPNANLLPADPVLRAKARFFIDTFSNKFVSPYLNWSRGGPAEGLLSAVEVIQALLPLNEKWAVGDQFSIADVAVAPFFARLDVVLKNGFRSLATGDDDGTSYKAFQSDPKYARFNKYFQDVLARDTVKATFDEAYVTDVLEKRFAAAKVA